MSRIELETKIVATLKKALSQPRKKGAVVINTARARYYDAMTAMGAGNITHAMQGVGAGV